MSHKIGEWRDGARFDVEFPDPERNPFGLVVGKKAEATSANGKRAETETILFTTRAGISPSENMLDAFDAGHSKGVAEGRRLAQAEIHAALGLDK